MRRAAWVGVVAAAALAGFGAAWYLRGPRPHHDRPAARAEDDDFDPREGKAPRGPRGRAIREAKAETPDGRPPRRGPRGAGEGPPGRAGGPPMGPASTARTDPDPSFPPVETLLLDEALWGEDIPNTVKGISVAWDGSQLWVAGIATARLVAIDPQEGHPVAEVDLDVRGHSPAILRVDQKRRRIYWVSRQDGSIRAVDLDQRSLVGSVDGEKPDHPNAYPVQDAALDADGNLWVAHRRNGTVTGYDPSLKVIGTLPGVTAPSALAVHGNDIAVLDSPGREGEKIVHVDLTTQQTTDQAVPPQAAPVVLAYAPDGTLVEVGRSVVATNANGTPKWKAEAPSTPDRAVVAGDTVAVVFEHASEADYPAESLLVLWDLATGRERARVSVGYEAKFLDTDGKRVFVGNGGDGSVSVIDVATGKLVDTWDAGNAAEQVLVDPKTGTRYVLDRLGGSTVYAWPKGSDQVTPWHLGGWPNEMAIDGRTLVAVSHYDAALYRVDLDSGKRLADIPLGVTPNRSDTLGDMDVADHLAAVAFPETGHLVLADLGTGKVRWTKALDWLDIGQIKGPGEGNVKLDPKHDRLYVTTRTTVHALALKDGAEVGSLELPEMRAKGYEINPLFLDGDTLFVGPEVVKVPALTDAGRIEEAMKVFWAQKDTLLGLKPGRPGETEQLVELDPETYRARKMYPLVETGMMRLTATYDPATRRVYATDMAEARVFAWSWP